MLLLGISSIAAAEVSTRVYLADGNTPLELADPNIAFVYRDIMAGTKLTIVVASDTAEYWDGGMYINGIDRDYGVLSARDCNDITRDWEGSRFEAAGQRARVRDIEDVLSQGFELNSYSSAVAGDWFIIDYTATNVGGCRVGFYDYATPEGMFVPVYELVFSHVRTRDFDQDTRVGLTDFAVFALYWGADCSEPGQCEGTDLDADGDVDGELTAMIWRFLQTIGLRRRNNGFLGPLQGSRSRTPKQRPTCPRGTIDSRPDTGLSRLTLPLRASGKIFLCFLENLAKRPSTFADSQSPH
jgi:hypothetical protein